MSKSVADKKSRKETCNRWLLKYNALIFLETVLINTEFADGTTRT